MQSSSPDLQLTLEYRSDAAIAQLLPTGLFLILLGLAIFILTDFGHEPWSLFTSVLCWVTGAGVVMVALWRRQVSGKPLFALTPQGIRYRVPWVKELLIPWSEIRGVDTAVVAGTHWSPDRYRGFPWITARTVLFADVTVILLSKAFYDRHIHIRSALLRGPGWKANFVEQGPLVQMSLHHGLVSVDPKTLRQAVEARWIALRDAPLAAVSKSHVVAMGESAKRVSGWQQAQIIVLLIGIAAGLANVAGFWELPGQSQVRDTRTREREQRDYWKNTFQQREAESKRLDAEQRRRSEELEKDLRRPIGQTR